MRRVAKLAFVALAVVLGAACDDSGDPDPPDAAVLDAALSDAALSDAALPDAASTDAGLADASALDAGGCPPLTEPQAMAGDDIDGDTWETYARGFFDAYCTQWHSSTLTTQPARRFAPLGMDWDDEASVRAHTLRIRHAVGVTFFMPPGDPEPSCDERQRIVRWIDAEAP